MSPPMEPQQQRPLPPSLMPQESAPQGQPLQLESPQQPSLQEPPSQRQEQGPKQPQHQQHVAAGTQETGRRQEDAPGEMAQMCATLPWSIQRQLCEMTMLHACPILPHMSM